MPHRPYHGGSQGAAGVNSLVLQAAPIVARLVPDVQWLHLSGAAEFEKVSSAYRAANLKAVVHPFFDDMPLALGAATMCISRAGASACGACCHARAFNRLAVSQRYRQSPIF